MTCIIFTRHPYNKGDVQQQHITFVHVTIGHFLHSGLHAIARLLPEQLRPLHPGGSNDYFVYFLVTVRGTVLRTSVVSLDEPEP